jgi:hypothetical protein
VAEGTESTDGKTLQALRIVTLPAGLAGPGGMKGFGLGNGPVLQSMGAGIPGDGVQNVISAEGVMTESSGTL